MRENEINYSPVRLATDGLGNGAPIIAPTFIAPSAPAVAPYGAAYSPYVAPAIAPAVAAPVVGGFGGGGLLETIIALSLLNKTGTGVLGGDVVAGTVTAQNISDLRSDVAGVNTNVHILGNEMQAAFAVQTASQAGEFRNLDNQICSVEKEAIKAQYESKIATLQSTNEITNKIDASTIDLKNQLFGISTVMASEFCDTKHLIERGNAELALQAERNTNALSLQMERGFCKVSEDSLRATIEALRDERECSRRERDGFTQNLLLSQQTNSILNAIDSQLQRQTSQIVQFGAGNVATPVNTNNQVG